MPELPEVHTIVKDLSKHISGYKIIGVKISGSYNAIPDNKTFTKAVLGKTIIGAQRIAKNILIEISSGNFVWIHLAMTGRVLLRDFRHPADNWTKVVLKIENGGTKGEKKELRFTDTRMFGKIGALGPKTVVKLKEKYGPEPVNSPLSAEEFLEILKSKKTNVKNVLLDQSIISGLGNIYATEALFLAKINPQTHTSKLTLKNAQMLLKEADNVLKEGIANRGSTLPDKSYVDIFGKEGSQQNFFKIYMKDICPNCKNKVSFIKLNGRGTYFCLNCQPLK